MFRENIFLTSLLVTGIVSVNSDIPRQQEKCDDHRTPLKEGNLGQTGQFPWYGVLRVHFHKGKEFKIAVTGIVLIKETYCIANAFEISKIPKDVLKKDSKAMFIPDKDTPWFAKVKDVMFNPEFDYSSYNTLALVNLDLNDEEKELQGHITELSFKPVCWPRDNLNTANHLYAIGYTDENKLLEKFIQKVQYVGRQQCDEFYNRAGAAVTVTNDDKMMAPLHYMCSFAPNKKERCVWDTGMVLASNTTGKWVLIGLGLSGPGCAAPARFLDMAYYLNWVERATSNNDYPDYRRDTASNEGFRPKVKPQGEMIPDIPVYNILRSTERKSLIIKFADNYSRYEFVSINKIDDNAMSISFDKTYESKSVDCSRHRKLIHKENTEVYSASGQAEAHYKVPLYKLRFRNHLYTCVTLKVESMDRSPVYLRYELQEDAGLQPIANEIVIMEQPLPGQTMNSSTTTRTPPFVATTKNLKNKSNITVVKNLKNKSNITVAKNLKNRSNITIVKNPKNKPNKTMVILYIKFTFRKKANLNYEVFGPLTYKRKVPLPITTRIRKRIFNLNEINPQFPNISVEEDSDDDFSDFFVLKRAPDFVLSFAKRIQVDMTVTVIFITILYIFYFFF